MKLIYTFAIALALSAPAALAQQSDTPDKTTKAAPAHMGGGPMMGPGGGMGRMMGGWEHGRGMCSAMMDHVDGRLAFLKTELKITDAQAPLWEAYAKAVRDNNQAMLSHCSATADKDDSAASLPDRMDEHERFMAARLEALKALSKTVKPLYAAFSDSQKKTADELIWGPMGMM